MKKSKFINLCTKAFTGDISSFEQKEIDQWIAVSPSNKNIFDSLKETWSKSEAPSLPFEFNVEKEWTKLEFCLEKTTAKQETSLSEKLESYISNILFKYDKRLRYGLLAFASILTLMTILFFGKNQYYHQDLQEIVTQNKQKTSVNLPDGSKVSLNTASKLKFKKEFSGNLREVILSGEAFFDIQPDKRPFVVVTTNARTKVIGTQFNIRARNELTSIVVKQGRVNFCLLKNEDENVILSKGEMSRISGDVAPLKPVKVDVKHMLGWLDNKLIFEKTPLSEIISELQRFYDIKIELTDPNLGKRTITATFENLPFETVLSSLCITLNVQYKSEEDKYIISN